MSKKTKWGCVTPLVTILVVAVWWVGGPRSAVEQLVDYAHPEAIKLMPLPEECVPTSETPPAGAMRIVAEQRSFYHLTLQKVVVCRTSQRFGPHFAEAAFSWATRAQWLPQYVGCCGYQFRRHVAVVVPTEDANGTLIVEAVLIQTRSIP